MAELLKTVEEQERWLAEEQVGRGPPPMPDPRSPGYGGTLHFANWITYHAVGFASGRYTLGLADLAAAKFGKSAATKELHDKITRHGLTINDVSVPGESLWQVEDVKGNVAFVNPDKEIEGTYAKDLGEVYANFTGLDVTPDMQAVYDVARFVGSISPVGKGIKAITQTAKINPRALRILQTGIIGLTTDTLLQVEDVLSEKRDEFSPSQALKTGGVFVLFGGVVEGAVAAKVAIGDALRLRQYFRSTQGIEALKSVPKADLKYFISAKKAVADGMSQGRWSKRYSEQRLGSIWKKMVKAYKKAHPIPSAVRLLPEKAGLSVPEIKGKGEVLSLTTQPTTKLADATIALRLKDGTVISDPKATHHGDLVLKKKIDVFNVQDVGWIDSGEYVTHIPITSKTKLDILKEGKIAPAAKPEVVARMMEKAPVEPTFAQKIKIFSSRLEEITKAKSISQLSPKMQELSAKFDKAYISVNINKAKDLAEEARLLTAKDIGGPDLFAYASMQDAADALMRRTLDTKNPYYQMPLARIQEDAAQGVALAKQALARFGPNVPAYASMPDVADTYGIKKTISRFPQKVKDQASLEEVGNAIAKDFGLGATKFRWLYDDFSEGGSAWGHPLPQSALEYEKGVFVIQVNVKGQTQGWIKKTIVHELGHLARLGMAGEYGREATHHPEFKRWVANAQGKLVKVTAISNLAKEAITPMTQHQLGQIEAMVTKHELTPEAVDRLLNYSTGESDISSLTIEQADVFKEHLNNFEYLVEDTDAVSKVPPVAIDINLPKGSMERIRKAAGSDEVLNNTMLYSHRLGGSPSNAAIPNLDGRQQMYAKDLENAADVRRRFTRKVVAKAPKGKEVNAINAWSSARYAMGQAEVKSGVPLRRLFSNIVADGVEMTNQNAAAIEEAIKKAGISRIGSPTTFEEGKQIADWLFEEDEAIKQQLWAGMSDDVKALTASYQGLLQGRSASLIRHARFVKWDRAAKTAQEKLNQAQITGKKLTKKALEKIMEPVRKAKPINAPAIALTEGRAARETGQLLDWLDTQTWGTRKFYYMSERELKELTDLYPTGTIPEELEQAEMALGKQPELVLPETMTREGGGKIAKGGSITAAIAHHMNRVGVFAATHDDLVKFWEAFASTNPSVKDINSVRSLVNTVLGFHHPVSEPVKIVREATKWFWRPYFLSPKRSIWFSTRNLHQNIAYGLSQTTLKEVAKSAVDFTTGQVSPWMKEDYEKYWSSRISQRKQMQHQFILQKQGDIISTFGNKAVAIIDLLGSAPIYSDEINRLLAWPTLHQTAYRNLEKFAQKKISAKKLWSNLDIDTLHLSQRLELHRLLDEGDVRQFAANWSEYKVENIHFRYETSLRSVAEQTPGGKAWIGLMTFPRGTAEILYQNGVKPFVQGFNSGNYRQSYKGLRTIIMSIFGSRAARWLLYGLTGRTAYGIFDTIFRYTPVAPGAARVQQMFDDVSGILYMADEHEKDIPETVDAIMGAVSYQLELFIPFCDVALDYYETTNDVYGVRLYSLLKKKALQQYKNETGKKFREADRDYHERIQHMFWGGAERGEEAKRKKGKAPVLKNIFGGGKSLYD